MLFDYWNGVRGVRPAPRRFDIEPGRLGTALPDTFILERCFGNSLTYRLAGTKVCENLGIDPRGRDFLEHFNAVDVERLKPQFNAILEGSAVLTLTFEAEMVSGAKGEYEVVLLPLVHTRTSIDRILGSIARLDDGITPMRDTVARLRLISNLIIWPTGQPHHEPDTEHQADDAIGTHHQSPFQAHVRNARLVRSDRRQFRVYEGGLSKNPTDKV
jgi:hypothetical protein